MARPPASPAKSAPCTWAAACSLAAEVAPSPVDEATTDTSAAKEEDAHGSKSTAAVPPRKRRRVVATSSECDDDGPRERDGQTQAPSGVECSCDAPMTDADADNTKDGLSRARSASRRVAPSPCRARDSCT